MERTANCLAKLERMNKALRHEEPDRVPISDFFWGGFLSRWRSELGLAADTDIYRYYDLDWRVVAPNMDPHIRQFEILRDDATEVTVHTGFGATIRKKFDLPMPAFVGFDTDNVEKMEAFRFDDPFDERRYLRAGDDQINGVGDGFGSIDDGDGIRAGNDTRGDLREDRDRVFSARIVAGDDGQVA